MKPQLILSLVCGVCAPLLAQPSSALLKVDEDAAVLGDAFAAFKNGDQAGGLDKLKNNPTAFSGTSQGDVQVIGQLNAVCNWLANERHPRTADTALLAIGEVEKVRGKLKGKEAASVLATEGGLYERILGDAPKAKASYRLALQFDARLPEALRGLARLQALDAMIQAKARENETLRQRALQPKP